jgi:hypothetical protein
MNGAATVLELAGGAKRLAPDTVPPFVSLLVECVGMPGENPLDDGSHAGGVARGAGADEAVISDA